MARDQLLAGEFFKDANMAPITTHTDSPHVIMFMIYKLNKNSSKQGAH